MNKIKGSLD